MDRQRRFVDRMVQASGFTHDEFDNFILNQIDPTAPGNLEWLLQVHPDLVYRRLPHLIVNVTPLRQAARDGPVALLRYFYRVARRAMRPSR